MRERLLVVDDDDSVRGIYQSHFTGAGFEVQSAASLKEAAALVLGTVVSDVLITDIARQDS